eukprot:1157238-Pelagomonas_calceolata.AAC.1
MGIWRVFSAIWWQDLVRLATLLARSSATLVADCMKACWSELLIGQVRTRQGVCLGDCKLVMRDTDSKTAGRYAGVRGGCDHSGI